MVKPAAGPPNNRSSAGRDPGVAPKSLGDGIYVYCGRPGLLSGAHSGADIGYTLGAVRKATEALKVEGMLAAGGG